MFRGGKSAVDVVTVIGLDPKKALELHKGFQSLKEIEMQTEGEPWSYKIKLEELQRNYDALDLASSKDAAISASVIRSLQKQIRVKDLRIRDQKDELDALKSMITNGAFATISPLQKTKSLNLQQS